MLVITLIDLYDDHWPWLWWLTWNGYLQCPLGSWSGRCPEPPGTCLPHLHIWCHNMRAVSTGSGRQGLLTTKHPSLMMRMESSHPWQWQAKGLQDSSCSPSFLGHPKPSQPQPWTSESLIGALWTPHSMRHFCPGRQVFKPQSRIYWWARAIILYLSFYKQEQNKTGPCRWWRYELLLCETLVSVSCSVYICKYTWHPVIECISYCHD